MKKKYWITLLALTILSNFFSKFLINNKWLQLIISSLLFFMMSIFVLWWIGRKDDLIHDEVVDNQKDNDIFRL